MQNLPKLGSDLNGGTSHTMKLQNSWGPECQNTIWGPRWHGVYDSNCMVFTL